MSRLVETIKKISKETEDEIYFWQHLFNNKFPLSVKALQVIDNENLKPKRRKGFNLVPRESKKKGTIYYARFSYNGKMLPTKFNTHASDPVLAEQYALKLDFTPTGIQS